MTEINIIGKYESTGKKLFNGFYDVEFVEHDNTQQGSPPTRLELLFKNENSGAPIQLQAVARQLQVVANNFLLALNAMDLERAYELISNQDKDYKIRLKDSKIPGLSSNYYSILQVGDHLNIYLDCFSQEAEKATLNLKSYQALLL